MKLTYSQSETAAKSYVPVALGNGDLSFQIDGGGAMEQQEYCGMTPDVVLTDAETALEALGELNGKHIRDDLIQTIFSRFCVGK